MSSNLIVSKGNDCIRNVQYQHLVEMLNFNSPDSPNRPIWKLFVMDAGAQKILAPLLKVNDLRENGVTLFLQLKAQRERVPEVPVVYFVEPTTESISLICQDLKSHIYDSFYLNFTSQISRDQLEELAQVALQTQTHLKIAKVYDQYLNYVTLEDNLFTLDMAKVTSRLLNFTEDTCGPLVENISLGIFSVLMSFGGCAPVISSPIETKNSLTRQVCSKLETRIKNHLINTKSPMSLSNPQASPNQPRPLLLIVDRRIDLAAPLKHSAAYNALIDEILGLCANRVQISGNSKSFDIDRRDWFWQENSTKPFPKVAEAVEQSLKTYKMEYDRVLQTTPGMTEDLMKSVNVNNVTDDVNSTSTSTNSSLTPDQLKVAINVLPELTERKRLIDTHLQISTALLESIKTRDLGTLFHIQQDILTNSPGIIINSNNPNTYNYNYNSNSSTSPSAILSALKDPKIGNSQDKLRLLLIYLIYQKVSSNSFVQEALEILKPTGNDLKAFQSVLNIILEGKSETLKGEMNSNSKVTSPLTSNSVNSKSPKGITENEISSGFGDFFTKLSLSTSTNLVLNNLVSSVKSLIPTGGTSESPLTKFVDLAYAQATGKSVSINNNNPNSNIPNCIDPRPTKSQTQAQANQNQNFSIDHIILFVIGGVAYSEYDQLIEHFGKKMQNLKFTIGATEILSPQNFLLQLAEMQK